MGHSRKDDIAKIRQERKARMKPTASSRRKENVCDKRVRFLVVCEGTKTEPNYFRALINEHASTVRSVDIVGEGKGTLSLVNETKTIKKDLERRNSMTFDRVWVVFDKDDFDDFNKAIAEAKKLEFQTAWTNEAFELWYYLHFQYLDAAIDRNAYIQKLEGFFRRSMGNTSFKYKKGYPQIYSLLRKYGSEDLAKHSAQRLRELYDDENYATHKPCTMVDKLVEELENPTLDMIKPKRSLVGKRATRN